MKKFLILGLLLLTATIGFTQSTYNIKSINIYDGKGFVSCKGTFVISTYNNDEFITVYDVNEKPLMTVIIQSYIDNNTNEIIIKGVSDNLHNLTIYLHMYDEYIQIDFVDDENSKITILTDTQKRE